MVQNQLILNVVEKIAKRVAEKMAWKIAKRIGIKGIDRKIDT